MIWQMCDPSNKSDTCLWCGRKLRQNPYRLNERKLGAYADGFFCGLRCAYSFAVAMARGGRRLKPISKIKGVIDQDEEPEEQDA